MKNIVVSISALFLAAGVLSGCGEKKEEAPKAEAPKAEAPANPVAAAATAVGDAAKTAADATAKAAGDAAAVAGDAAKAAGDTAAKAVDATAQAAGDAAKAVGDAAKQEGMAGMSGMSGMAAQEAPKQEGMAGMAGMSGMSGMAAAPAGAVDGEKVYKGLCFSCHDMGIAGAPKMGDKADWGPRIAKGADALHGSAVKGKNDVPGKVMPAKGGNPALSDDEVKAAVDYMMSKNK
ncbi:MAG: c-type cytochrome [Thiothrix sp.]|uniref:c-type cytochrome n=1 Tax=Thiothrix sp. TaxID=1032 RepID=UPI002622155A|nr:c-type cytochrome [Thiothrix sp.]MDD5392090.1 c-type cytochrome [Thiothrix sp.]